MAGSDLVKVVTHNGARWRHTPRDHGPTADARHTPRDYGAGPQHTHNDKTTASQTVCMRVWLQTVRVQQQNQTITVYMVLPNNIEA
jgi:hypothetical protein